MAKHNIESKSLAYSLLHKYVWVWHNLLFYRKVVLLNKDKIPADANVIFTPNHQNALMDALALLFNIKRLLIFVARSDIFQKKSVAAILYFLKILPIYRIRDGFDSLKNNQETFAKAADVLNAGNGLVILPEGNHAGMRRLRPLKKGFARIAFQTEEANDFNLDIKIVPIGIDYSDYSNYRSTLLINFGNPISVSDYYEQYKENQPLALNQLKDELTTELKKVIININSKEYYHLYNELRGIYSNRYCEKLGFSNGDQPNKFNADKLLIDKLAKFEAEKPAEIKSLASLVNKYTRGLKNAKISSSLFEEDSVSLIKLIAAGFIQVIFFPLYLYGLIFNIIPFQLVKISTGLIKDKQFHSSLKLVVSLLLYPIFHIVETLIFYAFQTHDYQWIAFFVSLPLSGIISWMYHNKTKNVFMMWRLFLLKKRKAKVHKLLTSMLKNIFSKTDDIVTNY